MLLNDIPELLYGGAAGGGKSEALLAGAAQYVDIPGYAALLLRRSYKDLSLPGALMDRSHKWWDKEPDAAWDGTNHAWNFNNGGTIQFGYLLHEGDETQYQSAEFHYVGFDELTQFTQAQYTYLFSRLRRLEASNIPLRMRGATNPGGRGHEWVRKRWNLPYGPVDNPDRAFISATLEDNPYVDQDSYGKGLTQLSTVTMQQLRYGDWGATASGGILDPNHFHIIEERDLPPGRMISRPVRHWDFGSQEETEESPDPDWTAGAKVSKMMMLPARVQEALRRNDMTAPPPPYWLIWDIKRIQGTPADVEELVATTAYQDGLAVPVSIEQERGASGKLLVDSYRRNVIPGFKVHGLWAKGTKQERAGIVGGRAKEGRVFMLDGEWNDDFLIEAGVFGMKDVHDDQVDGVSGAVIQLERIEMLEEGESAEAEQQTHVNRSHRRHRRGGRIGHR